MRDLSLLLQQFTSRYRTALLAKAGVLLTLGLGVMGVLAWRLHAMQLQPTWSLGVPSVLAGGAAVGLAWWVRQRWMTSQEAAAHLDQALGLQQRLLTATEFSAAGETLALYPLLLEDVAHHYTGGGARFPRPFDRTAGMLLLLLILLLLWPRVGAHPLQLAQLQGRATPPPPSPAEVPPQPQQDEQRRAQSASSQQTPSAGQDSSQPSASDQSSQPQGRGGPQQAPKIDQGPSQDRRATTGSQGQNTERSQESGAGSKGGSADSHNASSKQQTGASGSKASSANRSGDARRSADAPTTTQQPGTSGSGSSLGNGEALKAEIQELLKDVSGELKQLQEQLGSNKDQPRPEGGTSTDPNLYESPMKLDKAAGGALPIQLNTDEAKINAQRPGGGVGRPSGEVSNALPQTQAEDAQLANEPLEETPALRQPIPPEYRGIFERLRTQPTQPSETR